MSIIFVFDHSCVSRFVGMLPSEQLQTYIVRAVTGFGERVQAKDFSVQDLAAAETRVVSVAGLCCS